LTAATVRFYFTSMLGVFGFGLILPVDGLLFSIALAR
jgi:hypothetical protein